jgi:hypothetical protein
MISGVTIATSLLGVVHAWKFLGATGEWGLSTKHGVVIAMFSTEAELDSWWIAFQESQGRAAKQIGLCVRDVNGQIRVANPSKESAPKGKPKRRARVTGKRPQQKGREASDYLIPWSVEYNMPEYDLQ